MRIFSVKRTEWLKILNVYLAWLLRSILGYFTLILKPKRNSLSRKWLREEVYLL